MRLSQRVSRPLAWLPRAMRRAAAAGMALMLALMLPPALAADPPIRVDLQCAERWLRLELREPRAALLDGASRVHLKAAHSASGVRYVSHETGRDGTGQGLSSTFVWLKGDRAQVSLAGIALPPCEVLSQGANRPAALPRWRAIGQEPGWSLLAGPAGVAWAAQPGSALPPDQRSRLMPADVRPGLRAYRLVLRASGGGQARGWRLEVADTVCRDAMSGMPHPQRVWLQTASGNDGVRLGGCGGDPATLLTARPHTATQVAALPLRDGPGIRLPTLQFSVDAVVGEGPARSGTLSGDTGCNAYRTTWSLTGEGLSMGPVLTTRRACTGDAARTEQQFLDALQATQRFDVSDQGLLSLLAADGQPVLMAAPD